MKNEIIDLTNDEDYMLPEVKRKSLDEFISWAFDEHEEEKDEEEVYYATPPTKKLKF
jgi:hypothetical protein